MNCIIYDWPVEGEVPFTRGLSAKTGEEWCSIGMEKITKKSKYILVCIKTMWRVFLRRNKYKRIVCWSQVQGLILATLLRIFHVRKTFDLTLMTIIYKERKGIKGYIWYLIFRFALNGKYVDRIICFSNEECNYYSSIFRIDRSKFYGTTFGIADEYYNFDAHNEIPTVNGYILDAGRSNRDHAFLIDSLKDSKYKAIIVDRTFCGATNQNCKVLKNITYGDDLYKMIADAFAIVVPLEDTRISSGQTLFIQAMMFGKPIIVTENDTLTNYVINGKNGFIIKKDKNELINAINMLVQDENLYKKVSCQARKIYEEKFTVETLAKNIGDILIQSS